jgi:hypothetical protein
MSTTARDLLTAVLVEADTHRAEAARLLSGPTTFPASVSKAQVHADLARSCEQRAANLMTSIEAGMEPSVVAAAEEFAASASKTGSTRLA